MNTALSTTLDLYEAGYVTGQEYSIASRHCMKIRVVAFYLKSLALSFIEQHLSKYIHSLQLTS